MKPFLRRNALALLALFAAVGVGALHLRSAPVRHRVGIGGHGTEVTDQPPLSVGQVSHYGTDVALLATGGDGSNGNPWTGWEAAINASPTLHYWFPKGNYTLATPLVLGTGVALRGAGRELAVITTSASFTGTAITLSYTKNTTPVGDPHFDNFALLEGNTSNVAGIGILLQSFGIGAVTDVIVNGFRTGVACDQLEGFSFTNLYVIVANDFGGTHKPRGVWLVNGGDLRSGTTPGFTNDISFYNLQINMTANDQVGVVDDGGTKHNFWGGGMNAGEAAFVMAGVSQAEISMYMEGQGVAITSFSNTSWDAASVVGQCSEIHFSACQFSALSGSVPSISSASLGTVTVIASTDNHSTGNVVSGGANISEFYKIGFVSSGGNLFDAFPTVFVDIDALTFKGNITQISGLTARAAYGMTLATGVNSNVTLPTSSFVRITGPGAAFSISGIVAPAKDGTILELENTTAFAMTLTNEATSTAANRIHTQTGADVVLRSGNSSARLIYDSTLARWVLMSTN